MSVRLSPFPESSQDDLEGRSQMFSEPDLVGRPITVSGYEVALHT